MLSTICSAKQKSLQMCAELCHCQRCVTNRERQRVPQWRTRDGKTSLSVSRRAWSRYRQIAACYRSEMTSASGGRNRVAHHCKVDWCHLVKTLENQQTDLVLQALLNGQLVQSISWLDGKLVSELSWSLNWPVIVRTMYWLRWHYHVKDIAGAPYKIKKKERKEKKNKTTESPTVSNRGQTTVILCSTITIA